MYSIFELDPSPEARSSVFHRLNEDEYEILFVDHAHYN